MFGDISKRKWILLASVIVVITALAYMLYHSHHCSFEHNILLETIGGTACVVIILVFAIVAVQCTKCLCCLRLEPVIVLVSSIIVLVGIAIMYNNKDCDVTLPWLYVSIAGLLLAVSNTAMSCCFT